VKSSDAFVAWIDIMGAGSLLRRSLPALASAVDVLNKLCVRAHSSGLELHPLNDGVFAVAREAEVVLAFLETVFSGLADRATQAQTPSDMLLVRGALAFGEVVTLDVKLPTGQCRLLFGQPKSRAFHAENDAPPFGVLIDDSAVEQGVPPGWRWCARRDMAPLREALAAYFDGAPKADPTYDLARAKAHRTSMLAYLASPNALAGENPAGEVSVPNRPRLVSIDARGGAAQVWTITSKLGQGGTAVVYEAVAADGRFAVLKVLSGHRFPLTEEMRERFARESRHLMSLEHSGIIKGLGCGVVGGEPAILMERARRSLYEVLQEAKPLPIPVVVDWLRCVLAGVAHLHDAGLVHRDLTPKNLLFLDDRRLVVADFGTARRLDDVTITTDGTILGSLIYISQQQFNSAHEANPRDDVFSIGQIGWELLARERPVGNAAPIHQLRTDLPVGLGELIEAMRAHDPKLRPATAGEALKKLKDAIAKARAVDRSEVKKSLEKIWASRQLAAIDALFTIQPKAATLLRRLIESLGPVRLAVDEFLSLEANDVLEHGLKTLLRGGSWRFHYETQEGGGFTWENVWLWNSVSSSQIILKGFEPSDDVDLTSLLDLHCLARSALSEFAADAFCRGAPCARCKTPLALRVQAADDTLAPPLRIARSASCAAEPGPSGGLRCCICGSEFVPKVDSDEHGYYNAVGCSCPGHAYDLEFESSPWNVGRPMTVEDMPNLDEPFTSAERSRVRPRRRAR
jgi:serine/threonine protein kinase